MNYWAPCRVAWEQSSPMIDWCYLGDARFTDARFEDTIARAQHLPFSATFIQRAALAEFNDDAPDPAGLIFHMSRCGSTLVSQMLKAIPGVAVFAEPPPVDAIVRAAERGIDVNEQQHARWLRGIVRMLGRSCAELAPRGYVVKLDCWHTLDLALFRRAFPNTPRIFLYRDPIEVLVSQASRPAEWAIRGYLNAERFGFDPDTVPPAALSEYRARLLAGILRAVLGCGEQLGLINYSQLPDWGWSALPSVFGLNPNPGEIAAIQAVALQDPKRFVAFTPDAERKRTEATPEIRSIAESILDPLYRELELRRLSA